MVSVPEPNRLLYFEFRSDNFVLLAGGLAASFQRLYFARDFTRAWKFCSEAPARLCYP
jgi:hypothetical protein